MQACACARNMCMHLCVCREYVRHNDAVCIVHVCDLVELCHSNTVSILQQEIRDGPIYQVQC